jgi:hypothetical protein
VSWVDLTSPETIQRIRETHQNLTMGELRQATKDIPDDASVESGWYGCTRVWWSEKLNTINIENTE